MSPSTIRAKVSNNGKFNSSRVFQIIHVFESIKRTKNVSRLDLSSAIASNSSVVVSNSVVSNNVLAALVKVATGWLTSLSLGSLKGSLVAGWHRSTHAGLIAGTVIQTEFIPNWEKVALKRQSCQNFQPDGTCG